jgi:sugar/nucleoside kinase (ribokinase family)
LYVIGDANPDLIIRGDDVTPRFGQAERLVDNADLVVGGSAAIVACAAARLGVATHLVSVIGDDPYGRFITDELRERGVKTELVRVEAAAATGLSVILSNPDDRAILTHLGATSLVTAALLDPQTVPSGAHVHAASFFLMPGLAAGLAGLFAAVRARGCTTSLDTNWDPAERWDGVREVLEHTDVLLPNVAELLAITRRTELEDAARTVTDIGCTVAAKAGGDGGYVWTPAGEHHHIPAPTIDVIDTTGAGDSFDAGYLSSVMRGDSPEEALSVAVAAGSLATRSAGGTSSQGTPAEIETLLRGVRP